ncbi:MAG TPA: TRAP transporter small permease [Desulfosporosinus sp.]|nr:TRAP transporter small permease [Desulfosporosinus sp.]
MNTIVKGIDQLNRLVIWIIVLLLGVMSAVIFMQVIFRYVFHAALPWSEELARYLMVWSTFLGASLGIRRRALIGMEVLVKALPKLATRITLELVTVFQIIFLAVVLFYSIKMTMVANSQVSAAMLIPMSWAYVGIPIGMFLMILNTIAVALERWEGVK